MKKIIHFTLNGDEVSAEVDSHKMLLQVLREDFQVTGPKEGCGVGECGACTVLIDGISVNSCLYPVLSFVENGGVQCGFCTPGMIMSAKALLDEVSEPSDEDIRRAISGNLCRCTGYVQIIDSIRKATKKVKANE
jgi:carbon-monoxide dehydrogenase small subunit